MALPCCCVVRVTACLGTPLMYGPTLRVAGCTAVPAPDLGLLLTLSGVSGCSGVGAGCLLAAWGGFQAGGSRNSGSPGVSLDVGLHLTQLEVGS